jgi:hypothetical protein
MTDKFKLPIEWRDTKQLDATTITDLELLDTKPENEGGSSLQATLFKPTHEYQKLNLDSQLTKYTSDIDFLRDTQTVIKSMDECSSPNRTLIQNFFESRQELEAEEDFHSRYNYINFERFRSLNTNPKFLQILSLYNITSPILTLITPIIILILPFFLIRWKGISLSMSSYIDIVKRLVKNHAIGKLIGSFEDVPIEKRLYMMVTAGFYLFQVYQSALSCYNFINNNKHIHEVLFLTKDYLTHATKLTSDYVSLTAKAETFSDFNNSLWTNHQNMMDLLGELVEIEPLAVNMTKAWQMGSVMKLYYKLKYDVQTVDTIKFSLSCVAHIDQMKILSEQLCSKEKASDDVASSTHRLGEVSFLTKTKSSWKTTDMYHPLAVCETPITNSFDLSNPIVLTGPNASGKTTLLKAAMLNTILGQQIGYAYCESLKFTPYDHFHCYIDIPDTSGRDSLFQAEARRCFDILDEIKSDKTKKHFCVFDEIYSGTNPSEAVASAYAFVKSMTKRSNTTFLLTTHFYNLCELIEENKLRISNKQMGFKLKEGEVDYTYKMKKGISNLKGGLSVLRKLGYDSSIIDDANKILLRLR